MPLKPHKFNPPAELRQRAERRLKKLPSPVDPPVGSVRLVHELEVHKIELEMQNAELLRARDELERALENYTDLYDFAPVGYLSVNQSGAILESNLMAASMLGVDRSRLLNQHVQHFISPESRALFLEFLRKVFVNAGHQECELPLIKAGGGAFWADFRAVSTFSDKQTRKWSRVVFGDISARKQVEEAQRRVTNLTDTNRKLSREIVRRGRVEKALQKSTRRQTQLLAQSRSMQKALRRMSHQILSAQEEERKRISRELHDKVAQTLVAIQVHLHALIREAGRKPSELQKKVRRTQRLIRSSLDAVQQFARELRPTVLDDLGLTVALDAFLKEFAERTGVRAHLTASGPIQKLRADHRTALYRVAIEALNNVARHARARRVNVTLEGLVNQVSMRIHDDGRSFNIARALRTQGGRHLGLLGMRERVEMIGGHFDIASDKGKGTTLVAKIPLANPDGRRKAVSRPRRSHSADQ